MYRAIFRRSLGALRLGMTGGVTILLILSILFLLPGITAYGCFYHRADLALQQNNRGHILSQPIQLPIKTHQKWQMVYAGDFSLKALEQFAKIRLALGRYVYRVELKWVSAEPPSPDQALLLNQMDIQAIHLKTTPKALQHQVIWLIDPQGLAVLSYADDKHPGAVYADLKKLVKS